MKTSQDGVWWRSDVPSNNEEFREALYEGEVFLLEGTEASHALVREVVTGMEEELGEGGSPREAQFRLSEEEFFARCGRLRKRFYTQEPFFEAVREVMASLGFSVQEHAFDPIRLRIVTHEGFRDPKAAPVYYAHRDTWYANPQALITWWIPLHDVSEEETFVFFPDYFRQAVHNDSEVFDYDAWVRRDRKLKIGWQDPNSGREARYPELLEEPKGTTWRFSCGAGQILLFAGGHLHQTLPNTTGRTRFSMDFRAVHLGDHAAGRGAPNVDNRSRGLSLVDYVQPVPA